MRIGPVEIVACETCGGKTQLDAAGRTRGQGLIDLLRSQLLQATEGDAAASRVSISSVRCLWACTRSCAVHVRGRDRVGYVLAGLAPTEESARALLDYAGLYADSPDGAVPFRRWPVELKGHFLCRIPVSCDPEPADPAPLDPDAFEGVLLQD
jgi:predicted metal-binding protein